MSLVEIATAACEFNRVEGKAPTRLYMGYEAFNSLVNNPNARFDGRNILSMRVILCDPMPDSRPYFVCA